MSGFFDYPKSAFFGRVLPKNKLYEHAEANTALRGLFVREVDQIVWRYKLASETVNLNATEAVTEIQVFSIALKTGKLNEAVLRAIDKAIPFPLIFELTYGDKRKVVAAYKRPSEADGSKWVVSEYFATDWINDNVVIRKLLPVVLNLGALYDALLSALLLQQAYVRFEQGNESIQVRVDRMEETRATARELGRIEKRLNREKQFNKRLEINKELRAAKAKLDKLSKSSLSGGVAE